MMSLILISAMLPVVAMTAVSDAGCSVNKACYKNPENCMLGLDCKMFLSYAYNPDMSTVDFEMLADRSGDAGAGWVAVGFSTDKFMGSDSVVMCSNSDTGIKRVENTFNTDKVNAVTGTDGLSNGVVTVNDYILECSFTRNSSIDGYAKFYDIESTSYYFLIGTGSMLTLSSSDATHILAIPQKHEEHPCISTVKLDINNKNDIMCSSDEALSNVTIMSPAAHLIISMCGLLMALFY